MVNSPTKEEKDPMPGRAGLDSGEPEQHTDAQQRQGELAALRSYSLHQACSPILAAS